MKKTLKAKQPSITDFFASIPDEAAAMAYMESARWPNGVTCIHCGHPNVWTIRGGKLYTCKSCRKQFTIRTGTVMEASHIKVQLWVFAMYLMTVSRKSISSVQLAKQLGITQKSAWFMAHRIRESCKTASIESFWPLLKRTNTNGLPAISPDGKNLGLTTVKAHMAGMIGCRLTYKNLNA